jgi:hypothetical protein
MRIPAEQLALMSKEEKKEFFGKREYFLRLRPATLYFRFLYKRYYNEFYLKHPKPIPPEEKLVPYTKVEQWLPTFFSNSAPIRKKRAKKKKSTQTHFPVKELLFNEVIQRYYKKCADRLINGEVIFTGYHLGYMYIQKQLRKKPAIDWDTFNKTYKETGEKRLAYFDAEFTYRVVSSHRKGRLKNAVSRYVFRAGRNSRCVIKRLWRKVIADKLFHLRFKTYYYAVAILQLDLNGNVLQRFTKTSYIAEAGFIFAKIIKAHKENGVYENYKWRIENKSTADRDEFRKDLKNIEFFNQRPRAELRMDIIAKYAPQN